MQDGSGFVNNITYSNIDMKDVKIPIRINQKYCDDCSLTTPTTKAVTLNGVTYKGIRGTYTEIPVWLLCSDTQPCVNLTFGDINLVPSAATATKAPFCCNAYGQLLTNITPPLNNCVLSGKVTPQVCDAPPNYYMN